MEDIKMIDSTNTNKNNRQKCKKKYAKIGWLLYLEIKSDLIAISGPNHFKPIGLLQCLLRTKKRPFLITAITSSNLCETKRPFYTHPKKSILITTLLNNVAFDIDVSNFYFSLPYMSCITLPNYLLTEFFLISILSGTAQATTLDTRIKREVSLLTSKSQDQRSRKNPKDKYYLEIKQFYSNYKRSYISKLINHSSMNDNKLLKPRLVVLYLLLFIVK